jgi:hypothetical protein
MGCMSCKCDDATPPPVNIESHQQRLDLDARISAWFREHDITDAKLYLELSRRRRDVVVNEVMRAIRSTDRDNDSSSSIDQAKISAEVDRIAQQSVLNDEIADYSPMQPEKGWLVFLNPLEDGLIDCKIYQSVSEVFGSSTS